MFNTVRKLPPALVSGLVATAAPVIVAYRAMFGTVWGAFLSSALLYSYMWFYGSAKPYDGGQLALWFGDLPGDDRTAIVMALITVIGFYVVFRTASLSWKEQTRITLRSAISDEVEAFYNEVLRLTVNAQLHAEAVVKAVTNIRNGSADRGTVVRLGLRIQESGEFVTTRARLSKLSVEAHRLKSKHYVLLSPIGGVLGALEECAKALSDISDATWVHVPEIPAGHPNPHDVFVGAIDLDEWQKLVDVCGLRHDFISGLVGGIRGRLLGGLAEMNVSVMLGILSMREDMKRAMRTIKK